MAGTTTGTGALLRFMLRRERRGLPWWLAGIAFLVGYQSVGSQSLYDTPEKLARLRQTLGANPAMLAMSGPEELLATIGGEVVFEIFSYAAVVVALMSMFMIGRHTRTDEETGRAELIRSSCVGRHATLVAALTLAGLANAAVAVVVFAATSLTGLPVAGSALLALALAGVGVTFAGLAAVAAQIFENPRAVYAAVGGALGLAYLLRAAGDAGTEALSWLSPIGWGQQTLPYVENRWWPLLLPALATAGLVTLAMTLMERRDFGAGFIRTRPGPAAAARSLGSPLGLAWRLQRGSLIGWTIGLFVLGAAYGTFANSIEQFIVDNPEVGDFFPGGVETIVDSYLAFSVLFAALLATAYGVTSTLRARGEETAGRAEPLLATPTSRWSWLASHVGIAMVGTVVSLAAAGLGEGLTYAASIDDPGQIPRVMGIALIYVPAVWATVAVAVAGFGWLPRAAAAVAWVVVGFCAFVMIFGDVVDLPGWLTNASPFTHTPQYPREAFAAPPLLALIGAAVVIGAAGFYGFRRRDIG
ncbi:ABC transporter permease [Luedemannella helvata]|uniref:Exporter of polyketide antibiotics n=1 Tax=Luedemannella helvata TaxID=349315 RepID=A0ABN2JS57_9ACTN